jgi:hypothetical protein
MGSGPTCSIGPLDPEREIKECPFHNVMQTQHRSMVIRTRLPTARASQFGHTLILGGIHEADVATFRKGSRQTVSPG